MNTLIFEPNAGIAGDMTMAAFVDLGVPADVIISAVNALKLPGCSLSFEQTSRNGIGCTYAVVKEGENKPLRHLPEIVNIIEAALLNPEVKRRSLRIFNRLAEVEAEVHRTQKERVHFHEIGAVDTLVDVVGAVAAFEHLAPKHVFTQPVRWGAGTVKINHGTYPLPTPATALLLHGIPGFHGEFEKEWTTPTGAALLADFLTESNPPAGFVLTALGYGGGTRQHPQLANVLRIMAGTIEQDSGDVLQIETQVDDSSGEALGYLAEKLQTSPALDWFFTAVQMKKNRPGTLITVLCRAGDREAISELLFTHSSTIGVRYRSVERTELERRIDTVQTDWGEIRIKVASKMGKVYNSAPEHEDCSAIANQHDLPLAEVVAAALKKWHENNQ